MKKISIVLFAFLAQITFAQKFNIDGQIIDSKKGKIALYQEFFGLDTGSPLKLLGEAEINEKAQFTITGQIEQPAIGQLVYSYGDEYRSYRLFIEPGTIKINIDLKDDSFPGTSFYPLKDIKGTYNNDIFNEYVQLAKRSLLQFNADEIKNLKKNIASLQQAEIIDIKKIELLRNDLNKKSETYHKILTKAKRDIYNQDPTSIASVYLLVEEGINMTNSDYFTEEEKESLLQNTNVPIQKSGLIRVLKNHQNYARLRKGMPAPNFTLMNQNNKAVSLNDFKGKLVLIDFWAYWCAPCIAVFPKLNELYETYKEQGFEIISISTDTNKTKWESALKKHKNPWVQLIDEKLSNDSDLNKVAKNNYVVPALPTYYLIDPQGNILIHGPLPETVISGMVSDFFTSEKNDKKSN